MKQTPLTSIHIESGARMMPFAGYNMPVSYTSINEEHLAVRSGVGLFDVSHMGQFFLKGPGVEQLVQMVTSNDASKLSVGQAQYSCLPNASGGIVDDLLVYKLDDEEYMLVVNASNIEKDLAWITKANSYDVTIEDRSDSMALLAIQGPKATAVLGEWKMSSSLPQAIQEVEVMRFTWITRMLSRFGKCSLKKGRKKGSCP